MTNPLNKYQEYTEQELRGTILELIDYYGEGTTPVEGLLDLAAELDIKLKPCEATFEAYIYPNASPMTKGKIIFFKDTHGCSPLDVHPILQDAGLKDYTSTHVKVTITEVVGD